MCRGSICYPDEARHYATPADSMQCSLPASSPGEAAQFLEIVGGGGLGTGMKLSNLGVSMPQIRQEYEALLESMVAEVERRQKAGQPAREIARWVVEERRNIAVRMRWRSGPGTAVLFEIRDWGEYGMGGRTHRNVARRYTNRGFTGDALDERLIRGATSPNTGISNTAIKGARYLKHGGRVMVVFSLATTAYTLLTAPEDELERVIYQEAGGAAGGAAGASLAVGACLVFGIASGGWGLLACGVIGGGLGGWGGSVAGEKLYYSVNSAVEVEANQTGIIQQENIMPYMPAPMCVAPAGH